MVSSVMKLLMDWENSYIGIKELDTLDEMDNYPQRIFGEYYITYYICPDCGRLLYKIKAKGTTTDFKEYESVPIYNIFTCSSCKRFFASVVNGKGIGKLSELALVSRRYPFKDIYLDKVSETLRFIESD